MDRPQLLNEIINAVHAYEEVAVMYSPSLPNVTESCLNTILDLVEEYDKAEEKMVEAVCKPERKIIKIGIAVGSTFAPEDAVN